MDRILLKNASAVVTCDPADHVYYDCDILIEGPKILRIGKNLDTNSRSFADAQIINARGKFVYPGLINTHHHFFQTFVRNLTAIDYPNPVSYTHLPYSLLSVIHPSTVPCLRLALHPYGCPAYKASPARRANRSLFPFGAGNCLRRFLFQHGSILCFY